MSSPNLSTREYRTVNYVSGPLIFVEKPRNVAYGETARIRLPSGEERTGQVLEVSRDLAVVQVFEGTSGIDSLKTSMHSSVAGILTSTLGWSMRWCRYRAAFTVPSVSWASAGATSTDTNPSAPPDES